MTTSKTTILFLAANPSDTTRLRLDIELREIQHGLERSQQREQIELISKGAVRPRDVQRALLDHKPDIIHFSGHGEGEAGISLEDNQGNTQLVSTEALTSLFSLFAETTQCVLLNACYSETQAIAIATHIPYVIGMKQAIGDQAAIEFAVGFYDAIGTGESIEFAYKLGCTAIQMAGIPEHLTPVLIEQSQIVEEVDDPFFPKPPVTRGSGTLGTPVTASRGGRPAHNAPFSLPVEASEEPTTSDKPTPHLYPVWFGTNREPRNPEDLSKGFSSNRAKQTGAVYYGKCEVAIPETHRFGETGRAWWRRWATLDFKGNDHLKIEKIHNCTDADDFWQQLSTQFKNNPASEREALVFIHGYNNSFKDAAIRAAQIGFDLKVKGHTAFFSWPSKKSTIRYTSDGENIAASEDEITNFLLDFSQRSGAEKIHLIAHSMGNRGLLRALKNITLKVQNTNQHIKFGQIILAAPDLDVDTFKKAAYVYPQLSESTTIYASPKDIPVAFSRLLNGYPRLGFVPPVTIAEDIDTIQVNNFDIFNLGHGYFSEAEALLNDMFDLIRNGQPPEDRQRPRKQKTKDGETYWLIDT